MDLSDVLAVVGGVSISAGVALVSIPAALIVAGALLVLLGWSVRG